MTAKASISPLAQGILRRLAAQVPQVAVAMSNAKRPNSRHRGESGALLGHDQTLIEHTQRRDHASGAVMLSATSSTIGLDGLSIR